MIVYVDIDNTICITKGDDYENAVPIQKNIDKINKLHNEGHIVFYWTARGTVTGKGWRRLTEDQLRRWGCRYHRLLMRKPAYDMIVDDRAKRIEEL